MLVTLRRVKSAFLVKARVVEGEKKKSMGVDFGVGISCKASCLKEKQQYIQAIQIFNHKSGSFTVAKLFFY
jgi:hypothetical protein